MGNFKTFIINSPLSGDVQVIETNISTNINGDNNLKKNLKQKCLSSNNNCNYFSSKEKDDLSIVYIERKITSDFKNNKNFMCSSVNYKTYVIEEIQNNVCTVPTFDIDYNTSSLTYIGYGEPTACKILRISTSGCSYTSLWSNGEETLDKIWSDRQNYLYF